MSFLHMVCFHIVFYMTCVLNQGVVFDNLVALKPEPEFVFLSFVCFLKYL